ASERALESAMEVLRSGGVFGIYPEGTRTRDGYLHRGHTGAARLALRSGASIVPVGLIGTDEVQPVDKKVPRIMREVRVRFGAPAPRGGRPGSDRADPSRSRRRRLATPRVWCRWPPSSHRRRHTSGAPSPRPSPARDARASYRA